MIPGLVMGRLGELLTRAEAVAPTLPMDRCTYSMPCVMGALLPQWERIALDAHPVVGSIGSFAALDPHVRRALSPTLDDLVQRHGVAALAAVQNAHDLECHVGERDGRVRRFLVRLNELRAQWSDPHAQEELL